jgi:hypothetical protein
MHTLVGSLSSAIQARAARRDRAGPLPGVAPSADATRCRRGGLRPGFAWGPRWLAEAGQTARAGRKAPQPHSPRARGNKIKYAKRLAFSCQSSAFTCQAVAPDLRGQPSSSASEFPRLTSPLRGLASVVLPLVHVGHLQAWLMAARGPRSRNT